MISSKTHLKELSVINSIVKVVLTNLKKKTTSFQLVSISGVKRLLKKHLKDLFKVKFWMATMPTFVRSAKRRFEHKKDSV